MTAHAKAAGSCHSRAGGNPLPPRLSWTPASAGVTEEGSAFILLEALIVFTDSYTFARPRWRPRHGMFCREQLVDAGVLDGYHGP
jgi:hypothetical protein